MKKKAILILCLAAICGAGLSYFLLSQKTADSQYARYLPQGVVGTVNLTHGSTLADAFAGSALGRFLAKDTIHAIVREMGGTAEDTVEYDRLVDAVNSVTGNPAFRAVFGNDATLALLPPDRTKFAQNPAEALRQSLVVVAQTSTAGALDLLSRLSKEAGISRETVDGLELVRITVNGDQVFYGYAKDKTVLLAYAPAALKACVASFASDASLATTPLFQQALAFWQPSAAEATMYTRMYLNLAGAAELLASAPIPEIRESGAMLQGMDSVFGLTYGTGQGLESRGRAAYRYDHLHAQVKGAVDAAGPNRSLHLLKERTLAYNWASSLQPEMIVKALAADEQGYREADEAVREMVGVSLADLSRAFGPDYGCVLEDIVRTALFPVPKLTLFVGIRDKTIAETAVSGLRRSINASGMAGEEQEQVAGQTLYFWPLLPVEEAQPALVRSDSMLYLATGKQPLKDILTGQTAADVLTPPVRQNLGAELGDRITAANFGSFVLYPRRMSRQTGETIDWLGGILTATKNISLARLRGELVLLMEATELVAATTHLAKDRAESTMTVRLAPDRTAGDSGR